MDGHTEDVEASRCGVGAGHGEGVGLRAPTAIPNPMEVGTWFASRLDRSIQQRRGRPQEH